MLDPYITPCCDQKQLRYFFERVNKVGNATFFCEPDYPMSQFLDWMVRDMPVSEVTLATPTLDPSTTDKLQHLLSILHYDYRIKKNVPIITHLNLIVGKDTIVPDAIAESPLVTVAKDTFTYNFLLMRRTDGTLENKREEEDTATMLTALEALKEKTEALKTAVDEGTASRLSYEELEGAWIDYLISSNLTTNSVGTYYTLHGIVQQHRQSIHHTNAVTCVKGKTAYDEVMRTLSGVLRTKRIKKRR